MYIPPIMELIIRYLYFGLNAKKLFSNKSKNKITNKIYIKDIEEKMKEHGIEKGDTIMVHSSFKYFGDRAEDVIEFLMNYIGDEGNILMPTHPKLTIEDGIKTYDINNSKSTVGYLTDLFWKTSGVGRSPHPFSSVAAWGKDKEYLLEGNLNENNPLPHGADSPYYKMTMLNAKILCVGTSARGSATIRHVAEEVLDKEYPVMNLFNHEEVLVKGDGLVPQTANVRVLNLKKSQIFIAKYKIVKEWEDNGILIKDTINNVPFEIVDSKRCVEYMIDEAKRGNTSYPFLTKR